MPALRFKAIHKGEILGWFDTEEEAIAAIFQAKDDEEQEEENFLRWVKEKE